MAFSSLSIFAVWKLVKAVFTSSEQEEKSPVSQAEMSSLASICKFLSNST